MSIIIHNKDLCFMSLVFQLQIYRFFLFKTSIPHLLLSLSPKQILFRMKKTVILALYCLFAFSLKAQVEYLYLTVRMVG